MADTTQVMIGGYLTPQPARLDYESVVNSGATFEGVVLINRDLEGKMSVEITDHLKKGGAKALGGAGLVVGLFAPPLLLSTAFGALVGAGLGKFAENKIKSQIEKQAEQTIPWGGAGLIVAYPGTSAEAIDKAVAHALKKIVGEAEGSKAKALKAALADAQQKGSAKPEAKPGKKG
jgi:uncharacterized membrane protein